MSTSTGSGNIGLSDAGTTAGAPDTCVLEIFFGVTFCIGVTVNTLLFDDSGFELASNLGFWMAGVRLVDPTRELAVSILFAGAVVSQKTDLEVEISSLELSRRRSGFFESVLRGVFKGLATLKVSCKELLCSKSSPISKLSSWVRFCMSLCLCFDAME